MLLLASYVQQVVSFLSLLTLVGQVIAAAAIAVILTSRPAGLLAWGRRHALLLMFVVALTATLGSLFFSEIAGWEPCKKCWEQRIAMYPQVLLLGVALWKRDRGVAPYILILSIVGFVIAAEHYSEQVRAVLAPADPLTPCDPSGESCARAPFFHFGYITIPMMALTAFLLNGLGAAGLMTDEKK